MSVTTRSVELEVLGRPAPQGSKRHVGHGVVVESSKAVAPWRQDVAAAAVAHIIAAGAWEPLDGALIVSMDFFLPRPKGHTRRQLGSAWVTTLPDLSKLVRSTEDALVTAGLIRDDARIVSCCARKMYAGEGRPLGASIRLLGS